jgi:isopenicillin N synthase-like dioxygenase
LQVTDSQGFWYVADQQMTPGEILVLPGQSLHRITAGNINPAPHSVNPANGQRTQIAFHLHARPSAHLSAAKLHASGRAVPANFLAPITAKEFVEQAIKQGGGSVESSAQGQEVGMLWLPWIAFNLCSNCRTYAVRSL